LSYSIFVPDTLLFSIVVNLVIHISLGLLYMSVVVLLVLTFFLSTSQEIGWKSISEMTYLCRVGCKTSTQSINQSWSHQRL